MSTQAESVNALPAVHEDRVLPPKPVRRSLIGEVAGRGFRLTTQRRILLEIIQHAEGHVDAATLLKVAKQRDASIDRATVYRTLALLRRLRLVDGFEASSHLSDGHLREAGAHRDDVRLSCFECGKIEQYKSPAFDSLKQDIAAQNDFAISVVRFEVGGKCRQCGTSLSSAATLPDSSDGIHQPVDPIEAEMPGFIAASAENPENL